MGLLSYGLFRLFSDTKPDLPADKIAIPVQDLSNADQRKSDNLETDEIPQDLMDPNPQVEEPIDEIGSKQNGLLVLDNSDVEVRNSMRAISSSRNLSEWLSADHLIRRFVMLVDNIGRGNIPRKQVVFLAPDGRFRVKESSHGLIIDPESYQRYDGYADFLAGLDVSAAADLYQRLGPLIDAAYDELGNPQRSFDDALVQAIGHLQSTPILDGDVFLVRPSVMYKFKDSEIEALSRAQKQLLRTGPRNTRIIQKKLAEFATAMRSDAAVQSGSE